MCQVSLNLNALLIKSCSIQVENLTSDLQVKATEIETHLRFLVDGISLKILHCLIVSQTGFFPVIAFTNAGVIPHRPFLAER